MSSNSRLPKLMALVGAASAATLSSCTLPADQAWRKIKDDGLISYWSYEMGGAQADTQKKSTGVPQATAPAPQVAVTNSSPINQPGMMDTGKPLVAQSIASLPGFVRSPYTNPPRLVDVKGAAPGSTMICPYTQRPFIIPGDFVNTPSGSMVAQSKPEPKTTPAPAPTPSVTSSTTGSAKSESSADTTLPKVVINNKPTDTSSTAKSKPESSPAPVASNTTPAPSTATTPAPTPKPVQEIPYGSAIAGRPGFVNSPFAAKHQLVDVTGLPTGMEVKCPYTGKLFRVPPQDMASSKPAETAPLSSPEEPQKK